MGRYTSLDANDEPMNYNLPQQNVYGGYGGSSPDVSLPDFHHSSAPTLGSGANYGAEAAADVGKTAAGDVIGGLFKGGMGLSPVGLGLQGIGTVANIAGAIENTHEQRETRRAQLKQYLEEMAHTKAREAIGDKRNEQQDAQSLGEYAKGLKDDEMNRYGAYNSRAGI